MSMLAIVDRVGGSVQLHILLLTSTNAAPCQRARRTVIIVGQRAVYRDVAARTPYGRIVATESSAHAMRSTVVETYPSG